MKKITSILAVMTCCAMSLFALTGCDALGLTVTEQGIQGNSNTLLILIIVIIVLLVVVQRFLQR